MKKDVYVLDSFGELSIHGYKWTPDNPDTPVKAALLISHGMAETIERYERFASYLCEAGIAVYGHSHRGHGKTAGSVDNLGVLGDKGWLKMKSDLKQALDLLKADYPNVPTVILGHSMGSFLLRDFLLDYSADLDGAIISGTGFMAKPLIKLGATVSGWVVSAKGPRFRSKFIDRLSFGNFNKRIKPQLTAFDWLSRDRDEVEKYIEDPYCGAMHSASFFNDFLSNMCRVLYQPTFVNKKEQLSLFIFSGSEDPVGEYGKGVLKTKSYYETNGFKVNYQLYDGGRHEMLNETNRDEVFHDVLKFVESLT